MDALTFQTGRQLEFYRSPRPDSPTRIPLVAEELQSKAHRALSHEAWNWISGGAGGGDSLTENLAAFRRWRIAPRMACAISERDWSLNLFGQTLPAPILLAPIGVQTAAHPEGEKATARAAAATGLTFVVSTVSSFPLEEVARASGDGPRWFQLYRPREDALAASLLQRAERAGYTAIVVTLDTPTLGWRERNLELGHLPFLCGTGLANYFSDPVFCGALPTSPAQDMRAAVERYLGVFSNLSHTWADFRELRRMTKLPLLVKGIQCADDARLAVEHGADGVIVSNHGGRQVEGGVATLDVLPEIVTAVGASVPVLFDSGIRRGCDVFRALALGARAVLVGRPYMWALAVGGEAGVRDLLLNLLADMDLTFALSGKRCLADISASDLRRQPGV